MSWAIRGRGERLGARRSNAFRAALAILTGCVLAGALLSAGPASADSRQFKIHNESGRHMFLRWVKPFGDWRMHFDGRPANGAHLGIGETQEFELSWPYYAASLRYRLYGLSDVVVEYAIVNGPFGSQSGCRFENPDRESGSPVFLRREFHRTSHFGLECTAETHDLTLKGL